MRRVSVIITAVFLSIIAGGFIAAGHAAPPAVAGIKAGPGPGEPRPVVLDEAAIVRSGIETAPLARAAQSPKARVFGSVLDARGMIDLYNGYGGTVAALKKARAAEAASKSEYERLEKLNAQAKNVSDKALQAARAAWLTDRAELDAAAGAQAALRDSIIQMWGPVIARWITGGNRPYERIASLKDVVIQLTYPADAGMIEPPAEVMVEPYPGAASKARFVSIAPKVDPRIQGPSFFYAAPFSRGLAPGTNVSVYLPAGKKAEGAVIPASALVWTEGRAWAYVEAAKGHFTRVEVATSNPVEDGFLSGGFPDGTMVVVRGAEMLLSEEFRSRIQKGE